MRRVLWVKIVLAIALFCGFVLSPKLWISTRSYPLSPIFEFLSIAPPFDYILIFSVLGLLYAIIFVKNPQKLIISLLVVMVVLGVLDQSRWQPWFYQYFFMFLPLSFYSWMQSDSKKEEVILNCCRIIVVCIYFWSGLQKINPVFFNNVFPGMVTPLFNLVPQLKSFETVLAPTIPLAEVGIGIGLLSKRLRKFAVVFALMTHMFILLSLGPFGNNINNVIWPWNIAMMLFVLILFWRYTGSFFANLRASPPFYKITILLFGVIPLLSFFNLWDSYLSFTLYAGNTDWGTLYISKQVRQQLPDKAQSLFYRTAGGDYRLVISNWSSAELNVPSYPEVRIYKNVAKYICTFTKDPLGVTLVVSERRGIKEKLGWFNTSGTVKKYNCLSV